MFFCCVCWHLTSCYLSAVLLKQFIKQHWEEGEENFVHPAVSPGEKVSLLLYHSYNELDSKCERLHVCVI